MQAELIGTSALNSFKQAAPCQLFLLLSFISCSCCCFSFLYALPLARFFLYPLLGTLINALSTSFSSLNIPLSLFNTFHLFCFCVSVFSHVRLAFSLPLPLATSMVCHSNSVITNYLLSQSLLLIAALSQTRVSFVLFLTCPSRPPSYLREPRGVCHPTECVVTTVGFHQQQHVHTCCVV